MCRSETSSPPPVERLDEARMAFGAGLFNRLGGLLQDVLAPPKRPPSEGLRALHRDAGAGEPSVHSRDERRELCSRGPHPAGDVTVGTVSRLDAGKPRRG